MEKLKVLKKLATRKKMFEEYLHQIKAHPDKKGTADKKAAK
ncbi:MAG: hypothetical protein PHO01_11250 [Desulfotomaculaceae bacterium]|nr:hypothetical protein [Desulfotomaculaceae bacterium]